MSDVPGGPFRVRLVVAVYWQASQLSGFSREQATASSSVYVLTISKASMFSNFGSSSADVTVGAAACTEAGAAGGGVAPQEPTGGAIGGRADGAKVFTGAVTGGSGAIGSAGPCTGATGAVSPQPMATGRGGLAGAVRAGLQLGTSGAGGAACPLPFVYVPLFSRAAEGATSIGPICARCCVSSFSTSGSATGSGAALYTGASASWAAGGAT